MKNILLTLSILFFSFSAFSQFNVIHTFPIPQSQLVPCNTDTSLNVLGFTEWMLYQTIDSTMFGPIDSSCFSAGTGYQTVDFGAVNLNLPVYLRYKFDSTNQVTLDSNLIFSLNVKPGGSTFPLYSPLVDTSANCPDGVCTGIYVALETPNATGSGTVTTWYSGGYIYPTYGPTWGNLFTVCFPTQNITNETNIKEVIFRMQPTAATAGTYASIPEITLEQPYWQTNITEILTPLNPWTQSYDYTIGWGDHHLALYHEPFFPSNANLSYVDIFPSPNTNTIDTINVTVDWQGSLNFQPYTQLRGGLVNGSTTDRHVFNLTINGGNLCLDSFFEIIFWGSDRFTYSAGEVSFFGPTGCLFFGNGGKMVIEDDAVLNYGRTQQGLLALLPGGTIEIGNNATLNLSNTMVLNGHPDLPGEPQVYMTLNKGSKLNFLKGAHIINKSDNPNMKLNIYMEGGEIDGSGLPKREWKYVNLIYRNQLEEMDKNFTIVENPVKNQLNIEYISSAQGNAKVEIYNMNGAEIKSRKLEVQPGINYLNLSVTDLIQGVYVVKLKNKKDSFSRKIMKL